MTKPRTNFILPALSWPTSGMSCPASSARWKLKAQVPHGLQILQTLQTSTDCKANQLIKKKFPYSFIKLKFHSAHLVWLLCAQVAGIDSQPQFESVSLSRTHHPIHIPSFPIRPTHSRFSIPFPIPDPIAIVGFSRSVGLFICLFLPVLCPLFPPVCPSSAHQSAVDCQSVLVTLQLLYISLCPLAVYNSASVSASVSASISASALSVATTSHPWMPLKLCCLPLKFIKHQRIR